MIVSISEGKNKIDVEIPDGSTIADLKKIIEQKWYVKPNGQKIIGKGGTIRL